MEKIALNKKWLYRMILLVILVFGVVVMINLLLAFQRDQAIAHLPEPFYFV